MPYLRDYHILISHSWSYNNHYETVADWLHSTSYFKFSDYSVCCNNPLDTKTDAELKQALTNRISACSCIVVVSGMYASYSRWIDYEIDEAIRFGKPIIGLRPWGQERVPSKILNNATVMVGWNRDSLISAIRQYAL